MLALGGCQQAFRSSDAQTGNERGTPLPPTLARMQRVYPDLASGRFVCLADLNTLPQAALFRTLGPAGEEVEDQPGISVRRSIDETGAGGLRVRLNGPEDRLVFDGERSAKLALLRDWQKYNLLLFNIHGPPGGLMLEFTVRSGTETPLRSTRKLFAEPGWQLYRFDLAEIGEELDLADVRALSWRAPRLSAPIDLYFDDFLLADNTRYLFGQDADEGELYVVSAGRRIVVGARGRFELAFSDGVIVEWHAGDEHNLTVRSGLGPWPVPLPEGWNRRRAEPIVYDDPELWAAWGERIAATQHVVEQSGFRVVLEGLWRFLRKPDEPPAEPDPAATPEHSWRYAIYPSGQVYVRITSHARDAGWPDARVGYAVALNERSGFERVTPELAYGGGGDAEFVLMSRPDRQKPDRPPNASSNWYRRMRGESPSLSATWRRAIRSQRRTCCDSGRGTSTRPPKRTVLPPTTSIPRRSPWRAAGWWATLRGILIGTGSTNRRAATNWRWATGCCGSTCTQAPSCDTSRCFGFTEPPAASAGCTPTGV